jgi:hypothetical protein
MPAFALFLPVPVAVAATAVVHLANNLFKLVLVRSEGRLDGRGALRAPRGRGGDRGAILLGLLADVTPLLRTGCLSV